MTNIRHALLLGGTGFVGSALVEHLLEQNIRVTCLIHRTPPKLEWDDRCSVLFSSLPHLPFDQLTGPRSPDVIFHCARISGRSKPSRIISALLNRYANTRLLSWLRSLSRPPLLVLVAGTLVYGSHGEDKVTEDAFFHPISYAREYYLAEQPIVKAIGSRLPVMILRAPWVYGHGAWFEKFFLQPIYERHVIPLYGSGRQWMSCIHREDCARLILHLTRRGTIGRTYNLVIGPPIRHGDFVQALNTFFPMYSPRSYSFLDIALRHGVAAAEALTFSLAVATKYGDLYRDFPPLYPDVASGLRQVLQKR